jgi:hypothetical protein
MKYLTENEFDNQFTVVPDARGDTTRPSAEGLDLDSRHLWTIVDAEGSLYALSGPHYVNRIGYVLTEQPWNQETEAVWCEFLNDEESDTDGDSNTIGQEAA